MSDYGLSFLFDVMKDLVINGDFINILYQVIAKTVKTQLKTHVPIPEMPGPDADGNEPSDDDKAAAQKKIDDAVKINQDIDRYNEEVQKMKAKIQIAMRHTVPEGQMPEVALLRVNNFREPRGLDESSFINQSQENIKDSKTSARGEGDNHESSASLENFTLEDLPVKMLLVDQKSTDETHIIAYHSGKLPTLTYLIQYFRGPIPASQSDYRCSQASLQGIREAQYECSPWSHSTKIQTARGKTRRVLNQNAWLWQRLLS